MALCALPAFGEDQNTSFTFTVTGKIISDTDTNIVALQEPTDCRFDGTKLFKNKLSKGNQRFQITCPTNIEQITLDFQPKAVRPADVIEYARVAPQTITLNANITEYTFDDVTFSETTTPPATTTTVTTEHNTNTTSSCPACDDACKKQLHATKIYCGKPVACEDGYDSYGLPTTVRGEDGENITYYEICLSENAPECGYQEITDTTLLEYAECSYLCYQESYRQDCKLEDAEPIYDDTDLDKVIACLCNATDEQILAYKASLSAPQTEDKTKTDAFETAKSGITALINKLKKCIDKQKQKQ